MNWRLRVLRGTVYSQIPFAAQARRLKRHLRPPIGESANTPYAIEDGLRQLDCLRRAGVPHRGTVLEMGTGWLPVIPLLFHLAGFDRIVLSDTERLMDAATVGITREAVRRRLPRVATALGLTEAAAAARLDRPFAPTTTPPGTRPMARCAILTC